MIYCLVKGLDWFTYMIWRCVPHRRHGTILRILINKARENSRLVAYPIWTTSQASLLMAFFVASVFCQSGKVEGGFAHDHGSRYGQQEIQGLGHTSKRPLSDNLTQSLPSYDTGRRPELEAPSSMSWTQLRSFSQNFISDEK